MTTELPRRTYLRRRGRMTKGQQRAIEQHADELLLTQPPEMEPVVWSDVFTADAPLGLEIGFGMGHALLDWAGQCPDWNLLGIEVYEPGIGALLLGIERERLVNVRALEGDAETLLKTLFAPGCLAEVRIFFPDPWPKKRHHKRRLIQPLFADLLASRLMAGGRLLLATDWEPYAHRILQVLTGVPQLCNRADTADGFSNSAAQRPVTRFENRGRKLGHGVWDLEFERCR